MNNIPAITVDQFTQIVKLQFIEKNYRPIFGLGKGGIGKTESIRTLARELNIGYIDIRLLTYSEVDLKGIPYPNETHTKSIWLQNDVLPNPERDGQRGILVLDEITSVSRSVRTAAYQLLNEGRLGEYQLPPDWMIVCLGNGEEDGGDYQGMEANFVNRCSIFRIIPDIGVWKNWAAAHGIHEDIIAFISWRNEELHTYNPNYEEELAFASPRSWTAVSDILNRYGYNETDQLTRLRILSNVGMRTGEQFWAFCKYKDETVSPEKILSGEAVPEIRTGEILYLTLQGVVSALSEEIAAGTRAGNNLTPEIIARCANGIRWILRLQHMETKVMGLKDLTNRQFEEITGLFLNNDFIARCPELLAFAEENAEIFRK